MEDKKKEFIDFIATSETPPKSLSAITQKDIILSFQKQTILTKFLFFQILGALITLTFCPQFGVGFVEGHGITHFFKSIGDWACAAFCGSLFLSAGMIVCFLGMKGEELWWIWKRYKYSLFLLPSLMWSSFMLMNISFENPGETMAYHLTWIISAFIAQAFWLSLRSKIYALHTMQIRT
jgi:hypothetical protein